MQHRGIVWLAVVTAILLIVPLIAMQFTQEVKWTLFDFVVAGGLIFGSGLTFLLIAKHARSKAYRTGLGIAVGGALLLMWANLAVGVIGRENNPLNLMYFGVLAVGVLGATFGRLRSEGMARATFGMAIAQMLIAMVALSLSRPSIEAGTSTLRPREILIINACFALLFVSAGWFFRRASLRVAS